MTTFAEFADFFESHCNAHLKPATVRQYSHLLNHVLRPKFGDSNLNDVQRQDVHALHLSMEQTPVIANRMLAVGKRMYFFAQEIGVLDEQCGNPFSKIRFYRERRRDRYLSCEEYERLGAVLIQLATEERFSPAAVAGIRLLVLTGARRSEIESLKWDEVDFENGEIRLADSKTGPRTIEISSPVREVLESIPIAGEFVMMDRNGTRIHLRVTMERNQASCWNRRRANARSSALLCNSCSAGWRSNVCHCPTARPFEPIYDHALCACQSRVCQQCSRTGLEVAYDGAGEVMPVKQVAA